MVLPAREPRALVWMMCLECGLPLVPVTITNTPKGIKRVIQIHNLIILYTRITCPECGAQRVFRSQPGDIDNG